MASGNTRWPALVIHVILTYLSSRTVYGKPPPVGLAKFLRETTATAADDSSWWTDTDLESTLGRKNTLESISRNWQKYEPDALKRVFLKNTSVTCNDGSRSGYYLRKHPGSKIWLIVLEGGWYCFDEASCASRWLHTRSLMTSKSWQQHHLAPGILSGDPDDNALFWRANVVYAPYCSSDVWTGTTPKGDGRSHAFMGALILQEIVKELLPRGLLKARKLMLAGSSAGATGVLLNIDAITELLRTSGSKVEVRGLVDSGWFLDTEPFTTTACLDPRRCSPAATLKKGVQLWNSSIPSKCRAANEAAPWNCFYGSKVYESLKTPVFVFQWLYDEAQLTAGNVFVPRTRAQGAYVQSLRDEMIKSFQNVSAVFAPSCVGHVVLMEKKWASYSIGQVTFGQALKCWWDSAQEHNSYSTAEPSESRTIQLFNDNNVMLGDQAEPQCDQAKIRRCRRRQKRQRKLKPKAKKQQCRCRKKQSHRTVDILNLRRFSRSKRLPNTRLQHTWMNHADLCSHHLTDDCRLPNCNQQCPKSYDSFSGKPIDFEQMLRNAGVRSRNPIEELFL